MEIDLAALLPSWKLALTADRKSPQTIDAYTTGVRLFLSWCAERGHDAVLERHQVRGWVSDLLAAGAAPATARTRQMALKRFSAWLVAEDLADADPLRELAPPKLDATVVERLTDDECAAADQGMPGEAVRRPSRRGHRAADDRDRHARP